MSKIRYFLRQSWLLIITSFVFGLVLAATNAALAPKIALNEKEKLDGLMRSLMPDAVEFRKVITEANIQTAAGRSAVADMYAGYGADNKTVGFAFVATGSGFQDKIKLVIATDAKADKFLGYRVLFSNETPGFGSKIKDSYFKDQFVGAPTAKFELVKTGNALEIDSQIVAITGATVSSQAVVNIFNTYVQGIKEQLRSKGLISDAG
jgi:electron transport complex protein RnfG